VVPASEPAAARAEIVKLQPVLGKDHEILKQPVSTSPKKVDGALALRGHATRVPAVIGDVEPHAHLVLSSTTGGSG
jgi:hypothetical protein